MPMSEPTEQNTNTGINNAGENICDALSTILISSVRQEFAEDTIDNIADTEVYEYDVYTMIEEHGFSFIGGGMGRAVFHVPSVYTHQSEPLVVKMARPFNGSDAFDGMVQNEYEAQTWKNERGERVGEWLCPIHTVPSHYRYVVMPKCDVIADMDTDTSHIVADVENGVATSQYEFELNEHNIGVTPSGKRVIIDYGIPNINHGTEW